MTRFAGVFTKPAVRGHMTHERLQWDVTSIARMCGGGILPPVR
ncbi:MAG: hypothetical protein PHN82_11470 [bacterium]|nr:hypothetical protein [bacterium]